MKFILFPLLLLTTLLSAQPDRVYLTWDLSKPASFPGGQLAFRDYFKNTPYPTDTTIRPSGNRLVVGFVTEGIKPDAQKRGYLTLEELQTVCLWKSARSKSRVASNLGEDVEAISKVFLETTNERLRIGSLLLLNGIEYPTASVFMHFIHPDPYPVLDFRALEALGIEKPAVYTFDFWYKYVLFTRQLAKENEVDMRTLDKALWQWSKEYGSVKIDELEQ